MGAKVRAVLLGVLAAGMIMLPAVQAQAAPVNAAAVSGAALNWAESHEMGHPYVWAGTGPYGYDCSGAVLAAFSHVGITLPHNTVAMIRSGKLVRVYHPERGDLAFWGDPYAPYHVEFVTRWYHTTFGAADPAVGIGWHHWSQWFHPGSFWRVV